ncbi:alpha-amylase family glycosyl hydrolase [Thiothrix nivea]|uniref:1,4-alpha-glucan branching enzyme n=1 Tax=Thiothrix nivea (strain ATCC 35100 / DSM 5205 / JP2) TaxID=870187 RepID=A0A656HJN6_THINJ|nr:alpha-amylase family glycosyl hydrolase [Thiothrix nivea]EIJ36432.1 maltooligosyl trehalose hydrolase [Thiothrix nivea DSM 5205]
MQTAFGVDLDHEGGYRFSVWAPNAKAVYLLGDFNDWNEESHPLERNNAGSWSVVIPEAKEGDEYQYRILNQGQDLRRQDPYARKVLHSSGNAVIERPPQAPEGGNCEFQAPNLNELVIYELHIGTFGSGHAEGDGPATFKSTLPYLDELKELGINAIEVMPIHEFPGGVSWGYNPACLFAVESDYGTAQDFYDFVEAAHERGIAVILDVVYNHFGPSDLDLWQFDGWQENGKGGIYFYNDWRSTTPWGDTRPDYGRPEVRQFIIDNALMWARDFRVDGLRFDMSVFIRTVNGVDGDPGNELSDGWSLMQAVNSAVHEFNPRFITIAEDMQDSEWLTKSVHDNGGGYNAQWDAFFVHTLRDALLQPDDMARDMGRLAEAIGRRFNTDAFQRVLYTESHDEVANGQARVPEDASPGAADSWVAKRKSLLGAGIIFTSPGIPMIFQGQEFLEDRWFEDTRELDRDKEVRNGGVLQAYRDLIRLRLNRDGNSAGLCGQDVQVFHVDHENKVLAFQRWQEGQADSSVVVIANFGSRNLEGYAVGFPVVGEWTTRFNSNSQLYDGDFDDLGIAQVMAEEQGMDGLPAMASVNLPAYALLILSR